MLKKPFRAFFAIDLPYKIKKTIATNTRTLLTDRVLKQLVLKWVNAKNLHLTLCFLGNITDKQYININKKIAKAMGELPPFVITLGDLQFFPSVKKPIVLVLIPKEIDNIKKIAKIINQKVGSCDIALEKRAFKPHVTIAMVKWPRRIMPEWPKNQPFLSSPRAHDNSFSPQKQEAAISFKVTSIKLFRSEPQPEGSVYTIMANYKMLPKPKTFTSQEKTTKNDQ